MATAQGAFFKLVQTNKKQMRGYLHYTFFQKKYTKNLLNATQNQRFCVNIFEI